MTWIAGRHEGVPLLLSKTLLSGIEYYLAKGGMRRRLSERRAIHTICALKEGLPTLRVWRRRQRRTKLQALGEEKFSISSLSDCLCVSMSIWNRTDVEMTWGARIKDKLYVLSLMTAFVKSHCSGDCRVAFKISDLLHPKRRLELWLLRMLLCAWSSQL